MYTNTLKTIEALLITKFKKIGLSSSGHKLLIVRVPFKQNTAAFWTLYRARQNDGLF